MTSVGMEAGLAAGEGVTERPNVVRTAWAMLIARPLLAVGLQATVALIALLAGAADPWRVAADWWLGWMVVLNVATLLLLRVALHMEGRRLRDLYRIRRETLRGDVGWVALALLVCGPIAFLPNILLGQALWGDSQAGADLSFRALPVVAAIAIVFIFPIVQGAAELPTYFGFVMPRLSGRYGAAAALVVCALVLSLQHVFLPLLFDPRFIAWRALMFLPFALWLGFILLRRPTALPYLAISHALLDLSLPVMVLLASLNA